MANEIVQPTLPVHFPRAFYTGEICQRPVVELFGH